MIIFKAVHNDNTASVADNWQIRSEEQETSRVMSKCLMGLDRNFETAQEKKKTLRKRSSTGLFRQSVATLRVKNSAASSEKWFQVLREQEPNKSETLSVKLLTDAQSLL